MDAPAEIRPACLTQAEVAVLLGVPERTLKPGRHVRDDVLAWAREQRRARAENRRR